MPNRNTRLRTVHMQRRHTTHVAPERGTEPDVLHDERVVGRQRAQSAELLVHARALEEAARHVASQREEGAVGIWKGCTNGTRSTRVREMSVE